MKKFTEQQLNDALKGAPMAVKKEIATGFETADKIMALKSKYNLHIDMLGVIAELNRNMLLGLVGPDEFMKGLIEAKIPEKDAREIMKEINEKIFVPLREEMRKGSAEPAEVKPPQPPQTPQPVARPVQQTAQMGRNEPLRSVLASVTSEIPREGRQASLNPAKLLEDHEEPHIEFKKVAPQNLPGVVQPTIPPAPPNRPFGRPDAGATHGTAPTPIVKEYSSDPYREPIE